MDQSTNKNNKKRFFILTGPMGSGKSTLCKELGKIDILTVPARQILSEQMSIGGRGVPETDPQLFSDLMLSRCMYLYHQHQQTGDTIIFERGTLDMIGYAALFGLDIQPFKEASRIYSYHPTVFVTPDWPEIYVNDQERKMSYQQAKAFGNSLREIYDQLGYQLLEIPKAFAKERAKFIAAYLNG